MEIVEGKDHPKDITDDPKNSTGKKNGLLLHLKKVLHSTRNLVVSYSGSFILQRLI